MGSQPTPTFFVALAHTDTIAFLSNTENPERIRVSNLNLLPTSMSENLLFSMSFDSAIHYNTMPSNLDPIANSEALSSELPKRLFADCGAFQFRESDTPILDDGTLLDYKVAWDYYSKKHLDAKKHSLTEKEIKLYLYQILNGLNFCH